jgi:hypothetical protein
MVTRTDGFFDGKVETFKGFEFLDQLVAHLGPPGLSDPIRFWN